MLSAEELTLHIKGCTLNDRESQKKIYCSFYGYAMAVCNRYTSNQEDAVEILNDGFLKVFRELHHYSPAYADVIGSFKGWLRKIMVFTAIDHFRKFQKHKVVTELDHVVYQLNSNEEDAIERLSYEEIIGCIKELTPAYRTVLNLFIVEGWSHEEIAEHLNISTGTSKSNLSKARKQLQKILSEKNQVTLSKNAI